MESRQELDTTEENFNKQIEMMIELLKKAKSGENQILLAFKEGNQNQIHFLGSPEFAVSIAAKIMTKIV